MWLHVKLRDFGSAMLCSQARCRPFQNFLMSIPAKQKRRMKYPTGPFDWDCIQSPTADVALQASTSSTRICGAFLRLEWCGLSPRNLIGSRIKSGFTFLRSLLGIRIDKPRMTIIATRQNTSYAELEINIHKSIVQLTQIFER